MSPEHAPTTAATDATQQWWELAVSADPATARGTLATAKRAPTGAPTEEPQE